MQESKPAAIRKTKEFTNLLAVREYVEDLAKNCFALYDSFKKAMNEDEARNEPLKYDLRNYNYHTNYSDVCEIHVRVNGSSTDYKDFATFLSALNGGLVQGVSDMRILLNMSYRSGPNNSLVEHNHKFTISFSPEKTSFLYEANYDDPTMNGLCDQILAKLEDFPATTTIFSRSANE